ncbi:F-box/LRR-repeat protein 3-like [Cryptotermes secundus]|uniref:F-box/LRR-repeat protein 3-like n=1 Tax=Cryptotermes secundus TaxID=105785 RepID=UPI001454E0DD|nr:F-box/LRR-repeat protein 3-like [Cryptotermes secundus]
MASGKHFTDLPDELLLIIFSNLSIEDLAMSVQHVNSHWKNVSQDDSLWEYQTFSPGCKMSDEEISRHLRNMPALRSFCPSRGTNTKVVDTLCKYCRDIRHIYFGYSHKLSNSTLHQILKKFPHIEKLVIPLPKETDQLHFADLVAQLKKLTTLSFTSHCVSTVANGVLRAIADGCPSLQCVDMGFSKSQTKDIEYFLEKRGQQLSSFSVRSYISTVAHRLLTECANLESLTYHNLNADLPDTYIQSLSKMSEMRELVLRYFREGQTRNVSSIFKNQSMSKLITLYLYDSDDFDGSSLAVILTNCPQLQRLTVHECGLTDDGFQYTRTWKNLQYLDIARCLLITDKSMEYVGAGCPNLSHLRVADCYKLTNKGTEYVCSGCQKLKYLSIQNYPAITDDVMEHIFKCKQLEVLELSHTSHLLGINFHLIPSTLVHLTELHVHGCSSLDKKCMDKLKEEMPHLLIAGIYTRNEETDVNLGDAKFFISQFL